MAIASDGLLVINPIADRRASADALWLIELLLAVEDLSEIRFTAGAEDGELTAPQAAFNGARLGRLGRH